MYILFGDRIRYTFSNTRLRAFRHEATKIKNKKNVYLSTHKIEGIEME